MSEKRTELETTATHIVQKAGLSKLSFRTLADEVGVKSSSVHYYFREKGDLAAAIIDNYTQEMLQHLSQIRLKHSDPAKQLLAFIKIFDQVAEQEKFCLCGMMAAEVDSLSEPNRLALNSYFRQVEAWLAESFAAAEMMVDLKPEMLAKTLLSGLEGALLIDRVDQRRTRLKAQRELLRALFS